MSAAESPLSSRPPSPRISPITRLRHARQVHDQLQERRWTERASVMSHGHEPAMPSHEPQHHRGIPSVDALAKDLQRLWQHQQDKGNQTSDALTKRIEKIGACEKDALIVHLLQQTSVLQAQRNDVVAVGEKLTTQLVQQQHELRVQFKAQTTQLHEQLQEALHHHPEVARLEEKIAELQEANRDCEQKLLFAATKLHRSRQRERALRLENESDPLLWDL